MEEPVNQTTSKSKKGGGVHWTARVGHWLRRLPVLLARALYKANRRFSVLFPEPGRFTEELGMECWRYLLTHTDFVVYFTMVFDVMWNGSFLATLIPLSLFLWGSISRPQPTHRYWTGLTHYIVALLVMRYFFQFQFLGSFNDPPPPGDPCEHSYLRPGCLTFARFLGIWRYDTSGPIVDMVPDVLVLFALILHRASQQYIGLWG
jgi:hypothetical protein